MKNYVEVRFAVDAGEKGAVLNYHLGEQGVESIVEEAETVLAYFDAETWIEVCDFFEPWNPIVSKVKNENWNAVWEASFEPVNINDFCYVRAPFHDPLENSRAIDLILEPRMAFGTAHHETTFMMMSEMEHIDFQGKSVFDFGCGTAILSVLAEKLGASGIYAIDIEENAIENAEYNARINSCSKIVCEQKVLAEVEVQRYDVILANINRAVLLNSAADLDSYLNEGGILMISGILLVDEDLVRNAYVAAGFKHEKTLQKGEWKCMRFSPK